MIDSRESPPTKRQTDTGNRYPDHIKEAAYQIWAFLTQRNAAETARQLAQTELTDVSRETIAYWSREYQWAERATRDVHAIAPDIQFQAFSELLFAGLDGARYVRQVNAGTINPDRNRLTAAFHALDRIGLSPSDQRSRSDIPALPDGSTPQLPTLAGLTPDELAEAEAKYRSIRKTK